MKMSATNTTDRRLLMIGSQQQSLLAKLQTEHYATYASETPQDERPPDLVLLDVPRLHNHAIVLALRAWTAAPLIVVSDDWNDLNRVQYLNAGADCIMAKPFLSAVLIAQLGALYRRAHPAPVVFEYGPLRLDLEKREVLVNAIPVKLTKTEFSVLEVLTADAGKVKTHEHLRRTVWGSTHYTDRAHLMRVTVSNLRRKLQHRLVETEPGVGYRLVAMK